MRAVVRRSLHVVIDEVRNINHVPDGEIERGGEGVFGNEENTNLFAVVCFLYGELHAPCGLAGLL